ncbi:uncharacterized protein [Choristoneura fumiferana]|uniref:uncharacterized protein n=1 Tax=Choristoneura fumiferana TaxID=7141 RepID=UPI003D15A3F9
MEAKEASEQGTNDGAAQNAAELCRVGVRIPPFKEKPALWFAQLEAQFMLSNITSDTTKFYYTMAQLDPQYASEVEDIITNPPATNKYGKLKNELVKRLSATRERDIQQLLSHEELGDRKPSQLLRRMQHLAGPGVPEDLMRTMWTNRLPQNIQVILASQTKCTLEELAELADKVHDAIASAPQVAAVQPAVAPPTDPLVFQIAALSKQMEALTTRMDRMSREPRQSRPKNSNRSRSRSRHRQNSTRSNSNYRKFPTCWYHHKFGSQARCCVKPCDYTAGNA